MSDRTVQVLIAFSGAKQTVELLTLDLSKILD